MGDDNSEGMLEKKRMWSGLRTQIGEILFYWLKRGDYSRPENKFVQKVSEIIIDGKSCKNVVLYLGFNED